MIEMKKRFFKALRVLLLSAAIAVGLVLTSGRWTPALLPPTLNLWGVDVQAARRNRAGRLELVGCFWQSERLAVNISRLELPMPIALARVWFGRRAALAPAIRLDEVDVARRSAPDKRAPDDSEPAALFSRVNNVLSRLRERVPPVEIGRVTVQSESNGELADLRNLRIRPGELFAEVRFAVWPEPVKVWVRTDPSGLWSMDFSCAAVSLDGEFTADSVDGMLQVHGMLSRDAERIQMRARFGAQGWIPMHAAASSSGFGLHGEGVPELLRGHDLAVSGLDWQWTNGSHRGQLQLLWNPPKTDVPGCGIASAIGFSGNRQYLEIDRLDIGGNDGLSGELHRPVRIGWAERVFLSPLEFRFRADLSRQSLLPLEGRVQGVLQASASTFPQRELQLELSAERIIVRDGFPDRYRPAATEGWPDLCDLTLKLRIDDQGLRIGFVEAFVNQSPLRVSAELPWSALRADAPGAEGTAGRWLDALSATLELHEWKASDWSAWLPVRFRPVGVLEGTLRLNPGRSLSGALQARDFAVRPSPALPAIQNLGARVAFDGRTVRLEDAGGAVGGRRVNVTGTLDWDCFSNLTWSVRVDGEDVPLARSPEWVLNGDLDVHLEQRPGAAAPVLGGAVRLRRGTLLVAFDLLSPRTTGGPARRPPFFSIAQEPFGDWTFDLSFAGSDFMRVRGPHFETVLSASFDLTGTFAEPVLTGSARVSEGEVRFPGAAMRIDSGEAFITPGRPEEVQLDFTGMAQKATYVITLHVSNTLDDPHVQFQSTPVLSNAAIIQLLAADSLGGLNLGSVGLYLGQALVVPRSMDDGFIDRIRLTVGQETSVSGRETVEIRYHLNEDWYLKGDYDKYDAYNLDLVWILFEK